jgi:hypothetical protein
MKPSLIYNIFSTLVPVLYIIKFNNYEFVKNKKL